MNDLLKPFPIAKLLASLLILVTAGCGGDKRPEPTGLVPFSGIVTMDNKPLSGAHVMFVVQQGAAFDCAGITDQNGQYQLQSPESSVPGAKPGSYKVVISCMKKPDGSTVVADAETSPMQLLTQGAKETVPEKYSSFMSTTLNANVPAGGGTSDFKLTSN